MSATLVISRGVPKIMCGCLRLANRWILLTADKRIRYNMLEKKALSECKVKEFVFASGNLSGEEMATALESAIPTMIRLSAKTRAPFVAAITRAGEVHLRWPKNE